MKKKNYTTLIVIMIALFASGCVQMSRENPRRERYVITVDRSGFQATLSAGSAIAGPALRVREFNISPKFAGQQFVYRTGKTRYETDYYNIFLIDPSRMITAEASGWLKGSALLDVAIDPFSESDPDYTLEGDILELYGDFSSDDPAAVLAINFYLARETPAGPRLVMKQSYRREVPISRRNPEELVEGWSNALTGIMKEFVPALKKRLNADK